MKKLLFILLVAPLFCYSQTEKEKADQLLTAWHKAAAIAKYDAYFSLMTADAIFIGTDPTENWDVDEFKAFAKPYFDRGRAWNFTAVERNIFLSEDGRFAWFDELLDTPNMKLCRGSGVLKKVGSDWKIMHYVLSMTVPNDNTDAVVKAKSAFDDALLTKIKDDKK